MKCCPTCNRPIPPEPELSSRFRQRIYDFIVKHPEGVPIMDVMNHVYADHPSGGPESPKVIQVMVCHINAELERRGIEGRLAASGGRGSVYRWYAPGSKVPRLGRLVKRLKPEVLEEIRKDKRSQMTIADAYGISPGSVHRIKHPRQPP